MTEPELPPFPDLSRIAFRRSDLGEHEGGGHCAGLLGDTLLEHWELVLAQHLTAFDRLADGALDSATASTTEGDGGGWALTRPVLFAAHHVCEVALKTEWVARTGSAPKRGHVLEPHWTRLVKQGGTRHLSPAQHNEVRAFIDLMAELTPDGQSTRYPLLGVDDLGATWCCLSADALRQAVVAFVTRLESPRPEQTSSQTTSR